ncbi:clavesin-2 [Drosophila willistoni]|uniref:clavesin-2 n=1 Tax=Drosophila willistoni TaxID=7260 RepID=UPI001F074B64|nr:clavesin-2 [Drosophila willistoni]
MEDFKYFDDKNMNGSFEEIKCGSNLNNPDDFRMALKLFKRKLYSSCHNVLLDISSFDDDTFLSRFLFANNGSIVNAYRQFVKYFKFKEQNKSWLKNMSIFDNKIELSLRDGNPRVLKSRDRKGRKILTFLAANWIPQKYTLLDLYRSFLLTIDKLLDNVENQALGFVVIVDWTDVTMNQARYLTPTIIKLMIEGLQDCLPAKFLAIHFICQPWYIGMTSTILKKFLTDEMRNRIFFHGSNLISLHNHVNKSVLPPDLGGEGPTITTLDWYHFLLESSQDITNNKSYKLQDILEYSKIPYNEAETENNNFQNI